MLYSVDNVAKIYHTIYFTFLLGVDIATDEIMILPTIFFNDTKVVGWETNPRIPFLLTKYPSHLSSFFYMKKKIM